VLDSWDKFVFCIFNTKHQLRSFNGRRTFFDSTPQTRKPGLKKMNHTCQICLSSARHEVYSCREKMFGWGDEFTYFQCSQCGCLQIAATPPDLGRFYPPDYYSYHLQPLPQHGWKSRLAAARDFSKATGTGIRGRLLNLLVPARPDLASLAEVPARKEMRIIDVGCGRGQLLSILHRAGFNHLSGVDPYLSEDIEVLPGLYVRKQSLEQVSGPFDLIILNHVFEHVESGRQMLQTCRQRLSAQGKILLRIPTPESDAWEHYRENWVQLDAPRHLFLHTRASLQLLAEPLGLKIDKWVCDSTDFQYWASEAYRKGDPLNGAKPENYFSKAEMKIFAEKAKVANARQRGDQVTAVLSVRPT
jgi:2-polyprenyl-3-methyl-5-hydroxy-6-metoxy-1,4-benzoquinol methylase